MTKQFERTYEIDTEGSAFTDFSREQVHGLAQRLRNEAKAEGLTLSDPSVVGYTGDIGGVFSVTVRATATEAQPETKAEAPKGKG